MLNYGTFHSGRVLLKALAFLALMFGVMELASAQAVINAPGGRGSWTIYGFGNAQAVSDTLRALANFAASGTFRSLVMMIAVIGVVVVGASSGFSGNMARKFVGYIMGVMLTVYVLFGFSNNGQLQVRVEVQDVVDGTWKAPVNVPAVVGIPAALISQAGFEIMRQIEASFPIPDGLKMSQGAPFNLATALVNDASRAKITDPNLSSTLAMYVQDCFIPSVARGEKDPQVLISSTNFLEELRVNNVSLLVNSFLPDGNPNLVSCQEAYSQMAAVFNADGNATSYLTSASAYSGTSALSVVNSAADHVASWAQTGAAAGGSANGGAFVKQAAVLASFTGAFKQTAAQTGNSDFLTGLAVTQASESQRNSWIVGAEVFNRMMGYILAVLQVFVYAITPLILAASLVPSLGAALLKNFMQILLWLAIWQPMLAIVNFVIVAMQWNDLNGVLGGQANFGFTLSNMAVVSEKTSNMRAAATFVGTMVPALAWAMVKGSLDFSRIIGSAVGESFAQGAGNTLTTGNFSLNNGSMDSFTANKTSLGQTFDAGAGFSLASNGGINNKNEMGGNFNPSSGSNEAGVSARQDFGTGSAATVGRVAATGDQSGNTVGGGTGHTLSTGTTDAVNAGRTNNSGTNNGLTASTNMGANLTVLPGSRGGGGAGTAGGAPGAEGLLGPDKKPLPGADGGGMLKSKKEFSTGPLTANASVGVAATAGANRAETDQYGRTVGRTDGASRQTNGTNNSQTTHTASDMNQAGRTEQATRGQALTVTALPPSSERAAVHAQALTFSNSRFAPQSMEGSVGNQLFYNQAPTTEVGRAAQEISTPGHIVSGVSAGEAKADASMTKYGKEEDRLAAEARAREAKARGGANVQIERDGKKIEDMRDNAFRPASERGADAVGKLVDNFKNNPVVQGALLTAGDAKDKLAGFGSEMADFAGSMGGKAREAGAGAVSFAQDKANRVREALGGAPRETASPSNHNAPTPAVQPPVTPPVPVQQPNASAQQQHLQPTQQPQEPHRPHAMTSHQAHEAQLQQQQQIQQAALGQPGLPVGAATVGPVGSTAAAGTMTNRPNGEQQPAPQQVVVVQQNVTQGAAQSASTERHHSGQVGQLDARHDGASQPSEGIRLTDGAQATARAAPAAAPAPRASSGGSSSGRPDDDDDGPAGMPSQTTGSNRPPSR